MVTTKVTSRLESNLTKSISSYLGELSWFILKKGKDVRAAFLCSLLPLPHLFLLIIIILFLLTNLHPFHALLSFWFSVLIKGRLQSANLVGAMISQKRLKQQSRVWILGFLSWRISESDNEVSCQRRSLLEFARGVR